MGTNDKMNTSLFVLKCQDGQYVVAKSATLFTPKKSQTLATRFTYEFAKRFREKHPREKFTLVRLVPKKAPVCLVRTRRRQSDNCQSA